MNAEKRLERILEAVRMQAKDNSLWILNPSIGEAYITQSLRWLHQVIEEERFPGLDPMAAIREQWEDHR